MVEYKTELDSIFKSLADATRRDMLARISRKRLSVSELALAYTNQMSLAAVSKHIQVLEHAALITKERRGRERILHVSPAALRQANAFLEKYREIWEERLTRLEKQLQK